MRMLGSGRETPPGSRGAHARLSHEYANEPRGAGTYTPGPEGSSHSLHPSAGGEAKGNKGDLGPAGFQDWAERQHQSRIFQGKKHWHGAQAPQLLNE